jgi:hypothetical protein
MLQRFKKWEEESTLPRRTNNMLPRNKKSKKEEGKITLKIVSLKRSSRKNPMLNGLILPDLIKQKRHYKKLLFYQSSILKFLSVKESHGKEYCSMVLLEQERPILLKHVLLRWKKVLSSLSVHLILCPNMLASQKKSSKPYLLWLESKSHQLFSLMR